MMPDIFIRDDSIDLDQLLKLADVVSSGGEAKHLIDSHLVSINGINETRRRRKVNVGDVVEIEGMDEPLRVLKRTAT